MDNKKIAIVHFHPLEKFPPVMNLINSITEENKFTCSIYSTSQSGLNWYDRNGAEIKRVASQNKKLRYWCYLKFNIIILFYLLFSRPKAIVSFETHSIFPVFIYKLFYPQIITFIHHHEYISKTEIEFCSSYFKFLVKLEKNINLKMTFFSQTNSDRMKLYLLDNSKINQKFTFIYPNLPPKSWKTLKKSKSTNLPEKIVHIGSLSTETMYLKQMIEWVALQNGKYTIDFYTNNMTDDAKDLLSNFNNIYVKLHGSVNYFDLPIVLRDYDIGVTLYNGHIPNYVYNIPNKVFEYLVCGLDVWYSKDLVSTHMLNKKDDLNSSCNLPNFLSKLNCEIDISASDALFDRLKSIS